MAKTKKDLASMVYDLQTRQMASSHQLDQQAAQLDWMRGIFVQMLGKTAADREEDEPELPYWSILGKKIVREDWCEGGDFEVIALPSENSQDLLKTVEVTPRPQQESRWRYIAELLSLPAAAVLSSVFLAGAFLHARHSDWTNVAFCLSIGCPAAGVTWASFFVLADRKVKTDGEKHTEASSVRLVQGSFERASHVKAHEGSDGKLHHGRARRDRIHIHVDHGA